MGGLGELDMGTLCKELWCAFTKRTHLFNKHLQCAFKFKIMSEECKVIDSLHPTFITITVVDWVDVFIRMEYFRISNDLTL